MKRGSHETVDENENDGNDSNEVIHIMRLNRCPSAALKKIFDVALHISDR